MSKAKDVHDSMAASYCFSSVDKDWLNRNFKEYKQVSNEINEDERDYRIYWRNGTTEVIRGTSITNAFNKKFGGGAVNAVDWYDTQTDITHTWDKEKQRWDRISKSFDGT